MKRCYKCKTEKAFSAFHRNSTRSDGRSDECKDCKRRYWADAPPWRKSIVKRHVLFAAGRSRSEARRYNDISPKNWRKVTDPALRDQLRETYERVLLAPPPLPWEVKT